MKSLILFVLLLAGFLSSSSQNYIPLPEEHAHWNCRFNITEHSGPDDHWFINDQITYETNGDTMLNSVRYTRIVYNGIRVSDWTYPGSGHGQTIVYNSDYLGCFRNDSINKKVLFVPKDSTVESVLYDFNLNVGDTISNWWDRFHGCEPEPVIVQSIDSTLIAGIFRKTFQLSTSTYSGNVLLIEGIGSSAGIFNTLSYDLVHPFQSYKCFGELNCFSILNHNIYPDTVTTCSDVNEVSELTHNSQVIFPNPSTGTINFKNLSGAMKLIIVNIYGQEIFRTTDIPDDLQVNLTTYPAGVYVCKIWYKDNSESNSQFILQ